MNHDSLTIGVRREPGYVLLTAAGEIGIFTVAGCARSCSPWPVTAAR
jgi:hypothetical protein